MPLTLLFVYSVEFFCIPFPLSPNQMIAVTKEQAYELWESIQESEHPKRDVVEGGVLDVVFDDVCILRSDIA